MLRILARIAAGLCVLALLVYVADWAIWRIHLAQGTGTDQVQVSRVTVASLKGSKEEYYFDGNQTVVCTRSMFPLPTASGAFGVPCWYLRNHRTVETRF